MIIQCESCSRKFVVKDNDIPEEGRMVQCGYCSVTWHQIPTLTPSKTVKKSEIIKLMVLLECYNYLSLRLIEV